MNRPPDDYALVSAADMHAFIQPVFERAAVPAAYNLAVTPAPGANVIVPEPNAASLPATTAPALDVNPPENVPARRNKAKKTIRMLRPVLFI